ncbi:MAG: RluA family pseudouridine synthase [Eubacterium sp.]|nr:RluA family pseudouridine synthase [Eubacterium sp.]
MEEIITCTVNQDMEGLRIDQYLADTLTFSRSYVQKLIKNNKVRINGNFVTKTRVPVHLDDTIELLVPPPENLTIEPENLELDILYEDDELLVVNKPKDMVVHPSAGHMSHTLVNGLLYHCQGHLSGINGVMRPGIVHRIDKDTTGALVVCKTDRAHQSLAEQLSVHSITRKYNAIVYHNFPEDTGTLDFPIGRNPLQRKKMAVVRDGNGKRAVTHYTVLDRLNHQFNHIECQLETGRTHQIRVHMSYIHHPILGDTVYGPEPPKRFVNLLQGQTLHARIIGFIHPVTNQYIEIEAPLPPYFVEVLKSLEK